MTRYIDFLHEGVQGTAGTFNQDLPFPSVASDEEVSLESLYVYCDDSIWFQVQVTGLNRAGSVIAGLQKITAVHKFAWKNPVSVWKWALGEATAVDSLRVTVVTNSDNDTIRIAGRWKVEKVH